MLPIWHIMLFGFSGLRLLIGLSACKNTITATQSCWMSKCVTRKTSTNLAWSVGTTVYARCWMLSSHTYAGLKLPQRVNFVETLTKILCDNIPDFWRLGQSYLSGKLLKEVCAARSSVSQYSFYSWCCQNAVYLLLLYCSKQWNQLPVREFESPQRHYLVNVCIVWWC